MNLKQTILQFPTRTLYVENLVRSIDIMSMHKLVHVF